MNEYPPGHPCADSKLFQKVKPMIKEHPQAEILRAIADGKTIQWKIDKDQCDEWCDVPDAEIINCLSMYGGGRDHHFRVKPETITGWIGIAKGGGTFGPYVSKEVLINYLKAENWFGACVAIIQITYSPGEGLE